MVQPCPECRQTRRHKLSCDAPNRARRQGQPDPLAVGDTYGSVFDATGTYGDDFSCSDSSSTGGNDTTCTSGSD